MAAAAVIDVIDGGFTDAGGGFADGGGGFGQGYASCGDDAG